ncbi:MAG: hypothetical protein ACLP6E_03720, partial [Acidimicrobiales bacterium]
EPDPRGRLALLWHGWLHGAVGAIWQAVGFQNSATRLDLWTSSGDCRSGDDVGSAAVADPATMSPSSTFSTRSRAGVI